MRFARLVSDNGVSPGQGRNEETAISDSTTLHHRSEAVAQGGQKGSRPVERVLAPAKQDIDTNAHCGPSEFDIIISPASGISLRPNRSDSEYSKAVTHITSMVDQARGIVDNLDDDIMHIPEAAF